MWDLQGELNPGDLLVVNDTRVLRARLAARRASGGAVELLVLEPRGGGLWLCLARPAKRLRPGEILTLEAEGEPELTVRWRPEDPGSGGRLVRFPAACGDAATIEALLERYGSMPLPPYIEPQEARDDSRYQTRYAARPGAVAAPTAGLHLSDALLEALRGQGSAAGHGHPACGAGNVPAGGDRGPQPAGAAQRVGGGEQASWWRPWRPAGPGVDG